MWIADKEKKHFVISVHQQSFNKFSLLLFLPDEIAFWLTMIFKFSIVTNDQFSQSGWNLF